MAAFALRFLGDARVLCVRHVEACSTDPSDASSASSSVVSSADGCSEASRASLKSVDSSSASGVAVRCTFAAGGDAGFCFPGASTRFLFLDTKASMMSRGPIVPAHVWSEQAEVAEASWKTRRFSTCARDQFRSSAHATAPLDSQPRPFTRHPQPCRRSPTASTFGER